MLTVQASVLAAEGWAEAVEGWLIYAWRLVSRDWCLGLEVWDAGFGF